MLHEPDANTPLFREMVKQTGQRIDKDVASGAVYEPKLRWDEKDQQEFDKVPLTALLDEPYFGGGRFHVDPGSGQIVPGLWDAHRQDIIDLWAARERDGANTFICVEGIGSGKTNKWKTILRLMVMEVITRANPLEHYHLDPTSQGISFVCMSRNATLAKQVTFNTVLKAFDNPFFREYFPPQVDFNKIEDAQRYPAMLRFPKNIVIFPGTGSALSAIGYNLFGGGIDEANYLEVVDDSRKSVRGKRYDAAEQMYEHIIARMRSRFVKAGGRIPGLLMMFSNPRYTGDFLERMGVRSRTDKTIVFRRRYSWSARPRQLLSGKTFRYDVDNRKIVA